MGPKLFHYYVLNLLFLSLVTPVLDINCKLRTEILTKVEYTLTATSFALLGSGFALPEFFNF